VAAGKPDVAAAEAREILNTQQQEVLKRYDQQYDIWKDQRSEARKDAWRPLDLSDPRNAAMRPGLDPNGAYEINARTGETRQVGSSPAGQWVTNAEGEEVWVPRPTAGMVKHPKPEEKDKAKAAATKAAVEDENKLRDDFDKAKPVQAYRTVVPMLESAKKAGPTRAGDLNLVYAFAKLMDPESVVRESETGMVTATGTFGDRLAGLTSQLTGGQALTPEMRKNLIAELDSRFGALEASYQAHEGAFRGIAERRGLNADNIIIPIRGAKKPEEKKGEPPLYDKNGNRITTP
jgi:hypothetical protein